MKKPTKIYAIPYRRISVDEKRRQRNWDRTQADAIEALARARGFTLSPYIDDVGVSGGVPLASRKGGEKLLGLANRGPCIVIVSRLDRLFRNVRDAIVTMDEWHKRGVEVVSVGEGFDMTTPAGRAMAQLLSVFAEFERSMIAARQQATVDAKKARGEKTGGLVPYGKCPVDLDKIGRNGKPVIGLEDDRGEREVIRNILKWRAQGLSFRQIAKALEREAIATRNGKPWCHTSVKAIVDRETAKDFSGDPKRKATVSD